MPGAIPKFLQSEQASSSSNHQLRRSKSRNTLKKPRSQTGLGTFFGQSKERIPPVPPLPNDDDGPIGFVVSVSPYSQYL